MNTSLPPNSASRPAGRARFSVLQSVGLAAVILAASASAVAQDNRDRGRRGNDGGGDRGNANPQDMQARMMATFRERLGVTNDDEWTVISERLTKVMELRRNSGAGIGGFMFAGRGPSGGDNRGAPRGRSNGGNTDVAALTAAVQDKLPDAEIKARLERVRELRKANEAKLAQAQEELRAVLSVRQEAMAVLAGLLP